MAFGPFFPCLDGQKSRPNIMSTSPTVLNVESYHVYVILLGKEKTRVQRLRRGRPHEKAVPQVLQGVDAGRLPVPGLQDGRHGFPIQIGARQSS